MGAQFPARGRAGGREEAGSGPAEGLQHERGGLKGQVGGTSAWQALVGGDEAWVCCLGRLWVSLAPTDGGATWARGEVGVGAGVRGRGTPLRPNDPGLASGTQCVALPAGLGTTGRQCSPSSPRSSAGTAAALDGRREGRPSGEPSAIWFSRQSPRVGSTPLSSLWLGLSSSASREEPILTEGPGSLRPGAGRMRAGVPGRFPARLLAPQRTKALEMGHRSSPWDRLPLPSPHPLGFSGRQGRGASFLPLAVMFSLPPGPHTWSLCFCSRCHLWSQSTWQLMAPGS